MNSKKTKGVNKLLLTLFIVVFVINMGNIIFNNGSVGVITLGLAFGAVIVVYFIPTIVAERKKHSQITAIALLNIFLGWTFLGWVVALIWAVIKEK